MAVLEIKVPDVGEGVTEVELVEWHVKPGDMLREDDVIAAVMTDKATVEIPSLYAGKVLSLGGALGETLAVGAVLLTLERQADLAAPAPSAPSPPSPVATPSDPPAAARPSALPPLSSPSLRARARAAGVDLTQVPGSGPGGRILDRDLEAFLHPPSAPAWPQPEVQRIPVIGLRRKIAERMERNAARIPQFTIVEEVDVTPVEELRASLNAARGDKAKLTLLPFLSAALCRALVDHPEMNAHYDDAAGVILRHPAVHLGIATQTPAGLVVPVLRHAETLGPFRTAAEIARLAEAARAGKASAEELSGSTITLSSLGPLGAIATTPLLNAPEVAILGVNRIAIRPVWDGSRFIPRKMMNLSASFDHRIIDGWDAARFIRRLKELLEQPALIFLTPET